MNEVYLRCEECAGSGEIRTARRHGRKVDCLGCDGAGFVPTVIRSEPKRRRRLVIMPAMVVVWLASLGAGAWGLWRWL